MKISTIRIVLTLPAAALVSLGASPQSPSPRIDPEKVVLSEACGECHRSSFQVWKDSVHARGFYELHRKESAQRIARNMGSSLVKRNSPCLNCHYTPIVRRDSLRAGAGVTCESCHGAAREWINIHNNFGVREGDFQKAHRAETAEHRETRRRRSAEAGMIRPSTHLVELVSSCFSCHSVPDERLVNVGKHGTGTADFELVRWTERDIRHNFLESFLTGDGTVNAERPPQHKRVLYVIGRALDLEYTLRGIAEAKEDGRYFKAKVRRLRTAVSELREVASLTGDRDVQAMVDRVGRLRPKLGDGVDLVEIADSVRASLTRFAAKVDGRQLASLDSLYSGEERVAVTADDEGVVDTLPTAPEPAPDAAPTQPVVPQPGTPTRTDPTPRTPEEDVARTADPVERPPSPTTSPSEVRPSADRVPARASLPGRVQRRPSWQTLPSHRMIGPGRCGRCHGEQDEWWFDDPHFLSADPFLEGRRENLQIASLYGIGSRMNLGTQICMKCHGTVMTGRESREVDTGVACESCHGPGADYEKPHEKDYPGSLRLGLSDLKNMDARATACADCHYITDERLLAAGHASGEDFDYVAGTARVRHWKHALTDAASLQSAYSRIVASRGPVPTVTVARLAPVPSSSRAESTRTTAPPEAGPAGDVPESAVEVSPTKSERMDVTPTREPGRSADRTTTPVRSETARRPGAAPPATLSPAESPESAEQSGQGLVIDEKANFEQKLRSIKKRLEELYRQRKDQPPNR